MSSEKLVSISERIRDNAFFYNYIFINSVISLFFSLYKAICELSSKKCYYKSKKILNYKNYKEIVNKKEEENFSKQSRPCKRFS